MNEYLNPMLNLGIIVFASYWISISLTQKAGPFNIFLEVRNRYPFISSGAKVGTSLSLVISIIVVFVPWGWTVFSVFGMAGAIIHMLNMIGIRDYE